MAENAIDRIKAALARQAEAQLEIEAARKDAAEQVGVLQEQIAEQEKVVAVKKAEYEAEIAISNELKKTMGIIMGKPAAKKRAVRGGAVKETFREWATTAGDFVVSDIIKAGITPSGGYARILVTDAINDNLLMEVPDTSPQAYRAT